MCRNLLHIYRDQVRGGLLPYCCRCTPWDEPGLLLFVGCACALKLQAGMAPRLGAGLHLCMRLLCGVLLQPPQPT